MKFAIIAAGEGSRLQQEGVSLPKPLVPINGEAMIDRLLRIFRNNGADEIVIIVNTLNPKTEEHIRQLQASGQNDIRLVVKTTPGSMHSFAALAPFLHEGPFCLTTVDTIFSEAEFGRFIEHFKDSGMDGCMAVTSYIDDEKPLYVRTEENRMITGFIDANEGDKYISGGIYALRPRALDTLGRCMREGLTRMRSFQRGLIEDGLRLEACPFTKILDVDHAGDIAKAEAFLTQESEQNHE